MKKIISMLMICISVVSIAQTKSISSKIYKQYNIKQKSSITQIDSNLFDVFLKKQDSVSKEALSKALKGITCLDVIKIDDNKNPNSDLFSSMKNDFGKYGYNLFKETREVDSKSYMGIKKDSQKITGIIGINENDNKISVLEFTGTDIKLDNIARLSSLMNLQGVEKFSVMAKNGDNAQPSNKTNIMVKGDTKTLPLIVIDGVVANKAALNATKPDDIQSISVLKNKEAIVYPGGENGVVVVTTKKQAKATPLYVIDGKVVTAQESEALDVNKIDSINVLKGESAMKAYGKRGTNGVVIITTKKKK